MPLTDPVPSSAFDVLERNIKDTDKFVNQETGTFTNRVGKVIKPISVIESEANAAIISLGWDTAGEFATGFTYEKLNDVGRDSSGSWWRYNGSDLPKVIAAGAVPSSPNFSVISFETADNVPWDAGKSVGYVLDDYRGVKDELYSQADIVDNGTQNQLGDSQFVDALQKIFKSKISNVSELKNVKNLSLAVEVLEYRSGTGLGGGNFYYSATTPKIQHNGGMVISPTVPWDGSLSGLADFVNGVGETESLGSGCYVRVCSDVKLEYFGGFISVVDHCTASWIAANLYAAKNHKELILIDGPIRVNETCTIDGVDTNFRSIKLKGTFATTGVALNYTPDTCGSVVMTDGAPALIIKFNLFSNENFVFKGVGFIDASYYPREQPLEPFAPIIIEKGNADGSSPRYITGHVLEDVTFSGYEAGVDIIGKGLANPSLNFIGPISASRSSVYNQGDLIRATDATLNHLWISDSNLFGLDGFGVNLVKTSGGTGGFADVTYSNTMIEGAKGLINTSGHHTGARSRLVLNSVNRESCGFYGPNIDGLYTGNPLGKTTDTDIIINGTWTKGIAFNEQSLPIAETGATVSSTVPAEFIFTSSENLTPQTVNYLKETFTLAAGGTISKNFIGTGTDAIDATLRVVLNDGRRGVKTANCYGYNNGTKLRTESGVIDPTITVTFSDGPIGAICGVSVTNTSLTSTGVTFELVNNTNMNVYSIG